MRYYVYTDGAYSSERGVGSWSYLIYTDTNFIEWVSNKSVHIKKPTYAEDIAIGIASHTLIDMKLTKDDTVIINTDSLSTLKLLESIAGGSTSFGTSDIIVQDCIKNFMKLNEVTNVELLKTHAHRNSLNPNTCVDRMAKYALRS